MHIPESYSDEEVLNLMGFLPKHRAERLLTASADLEGVLDKVDAIRDELPDEGYYEDLAWEIERDLGDNYTKVVNNAVKKHLDAVKAKFAQIERMLNEAMGE